MGPSGIEPLTSRLSSVRSNQLSYGPIPFKRAKEKSLLYLLFKVKLKALPLELLKAAFERGKDKTLRK